MKNVVACLPSPNVAIESAFKGLSTSSSTFCLDPQSQQLQQTGQQLSIANGSSQLSANDIFSRSNHLIKRPSTMVTSDAMNQVAKALNSANQQNKSDANSQNTVLRNRRQAIVPPKLATDANQSEGEMAADSEVQVGQLVDVDDGDGDNEQKGDSAARQLALTTEEATMRALRRKRSGGGSGTQVEQQASAAPPARPDNPAMNRRYSGGSQTNLPTFFIEPSSDTRTSSAGVNDSSRVSATGTPEVAERRPDSQMTNIDSIVSSGSSTNLSLR